MKPAANGHARTARDAARHYLGCGVYPVPVKKGTKKPGAPGWDCTGWEQLRVAPSDIDRLFGPDSGLGLLLGEPSGGLVDIDLDSPEAVAAAPFLLPATGMVSGRASGRSHYWFVTDAPPALAADKYRDPCIADRDKNLLLELRSTGGQTVVPPTVYPADPEKGRPNAEPCVWHRADEPARVDVAVLQTAVRGIAAASLLARYWPTGSRHDASLALAGGLLRAGWLEEAVEKFVRAVCAAAKDDEVNDRVGSIQSTAERLRNGEQTTGWPKLKEYIGERGPAVVSAVTKWLNVPKNTPNEPGVKWGGSKPAAPYRPLPEWKPFPVALLPEALGAFVGTVAAAMRCDPSYVALPALSVCAGMIGATRTVRLKRSWHEPAMAWTAVVGESGTLKTPPYRRAIAPVVALQVEHLKAHRAAMETYRSELREYERNKKKAKDDDPGDPPVEPAAVRIYSRDTTVEALAGLLTHNRDRFLVGRDELSGWLASFNQYKAKGGSDLANWLELHGLGTLCVDRKTGEPKTIFVSGVGVSVCGGIQPGVLREALSTQHFSAGIPARLLFAYPPRLPKEWTEDDIDEAAEARYTRLVRALAALNPRAAEEEGDEATPVAVKMSAAAKAEWVAFYRRFADRQTAADGDLAAAFSKLEGYAARLSLLAHVCASVDAGGDGTADVAVESVRAGIGLAEWFTYEAERVYQMLGEDRADGDARALVEQARRLADHHGGRVTPASCGTRTARSTGPPRRRRRHSTAWSGPGWGGGSTSPRARRAGGRHAASFRVLRPTKPTKPPTTTPARTAETPRLRPTQPPEARRNPPPHPQAVRAETPTPQAIRRPIPERERGFRRFRRT